MENPIPSNVALAVNKSTAPRKSLDALPAFRSLEDKYAVAIYATHTGSAIVGYRGTGKVLFSEGDHAKAEGGKARGAAEVGQMVHYIIGLLLWANTNMPTPEVAAVLADISSFGTRH